MHHVHAWSPGRSEKAVRSPGTGVRDGCKLPQRYWESNTEPSLRHLAFKKKNLPFLYSFPPLFLSYPLLSLSSPPSLTFPSSTSSSLLPFSSLLLLSFLFSLSPSVLHPFLVPSLTVWLPVVQAGLELLPQPPSCWDDRHVPLHCLSQCSSPGCGGQLESSGSYSGSAAMATGKVSEGKGFAQKGKAQLASYSQDRGLSPPGRACRPHI